MDHSAQRYCSTDPAVYLGDFNDISDAEDDRVTSSTKWVARKDNAIREKRQEEEEAEGAILLIAAEDGKKIHARINIVKRGRNPEAPSKENIQTAAAPTSGEGYPQAPSEEEENTALNPQASDKENRQTADVAAFRDPEPLTEEREEGVGESEPRSESTPQHRRRVWRAGAKASRRRLVNKRLRRRLARASNCVHNQFILQKILDTQIAANRTYVKIAEILNS